MTVGQNIFIDFKIIQDSESSKLVEELDMLLILKNSVYIWSKTVSPHQMRQYCASLIVDYPERDLHNRIIKMRAEKATYKDISDATGVPIKRLGYYLVTDPNKVWTIDDWIRNYHHKDSMIYSKVDFVIDPNERFVSRFQLKGTDGNVVERIE